MSIRPIKSLKNPELKRPSALKSIPRNSDLIWLDKNENLDPVLMEHNHKILQNISKLSLATYPESGELYRKLSLWLGISPDCLILTPGSDGAIRLVFDSFVEQGDTVVHTFPTFAMYPVYSQMFGAKVFQIEYERKNDSPYLDSEKIIISIQKYRPKLLCIPNPDSPTGTVLEESVLDKILKECEKNETVLLIDEAYHPFYEWTIIPKVEKSRNLVVARTFAKAWGLAGLRIGYAAAHPETIEYLHKMRPMYEVNTLAVDFMDKIIDEPEKMMESVIRMKEGKKFFHEEMNQLGFRVLNTEGNFIHVSFGDFAQKIHSELSKKVLYRANFDHISLLGYSRFSIAPKSIMQFVVENIKQIISGK